MNIVRVLKRHIYFITFFTATLAALFLAGVFVAYYFNATDYINTIPDVNNKYFLIWRIVLYISVYTVWQPWILWLVKRDSCLFKPEKINYLLAYKNKLILFCLTVEFIIIQNSIAQLLAMGH